MALKVPLKHTSKWISLTDEKQLMKLAFACIMLGFTYFSNRLINV